MAESPQFLKHPIQEAAFPPARTIKNLLPEFIMTVIFLVFQLAYIVLISMRIIYIIGAPQTSKWIDYLLLSLILLPHLYKTFLGVLMILCIAEDKDGAEVPVIWTGFFKTLGKVSVYILGGFMTLTLAFFIYMLVIIDKRETPGIIFAVVMIVLTLVENLLYGFSYYMLNDKITKVGRLVYIRLPIRQ